MEVLDFRCDAPFWSNSVSEATGVERRASRPNFKFVTPKN